MSNPFKKLFNALLVIRQQYKLKFTLIFLVIILSGILIVTWCRPVNSRTGTASENQGHSADDGHDESDHEGEEIWTCSMHPQIKLPKPGTCPICFMELIRLDTSGGSDAEPILTLTEKAIELARINTAPAMYFNVEKEINLNGKIGIDETTRQDISSRFSGRIEKLYINFTGISVKKGDHVFEIYSPELFSAQDAYIKTYLAYQNSLKASDSDYIRTEKSALKAAESRLSLLGITKSQIDYLRRTKKATETIPVFSEYTGIVIDKKVKEGAYVKTGTVIYSLADLSRVWIMLDAYESDIQWLRYGQDVTVAVDAYPGKEYHGRISYIDPVLNEKTRTVKVRVSLDNSNRLLKPGMLVTGKVKSRLTEDNMIIDDSLAGKWISPMHPEIIKDKPGYCDICGMPLVKASELGFVKDQKSFTKKLVIPETAPLITGKRAIVYVETINEDGEYVYEGKEVVLGPKAGGYYVVESGLEAGEKVVIQGNFKLDAAMQILAKPSMMNPGDDEDAIEKTPHEDYHGEKETMSDEERKTRQRAFNNDLLTHMVTVNNQLAAGDAVASQKAAKALLGFIEADQGNLFNKSELDELLFELYVLESSGDIGALRSAAIGVNKLVYNVVHGIGVTSNAPYYYFKCTQGYDGQDVFWFNDKKRIANPFAGKSPNVCGEIIATLGGK